ncbi:hypothetical protein ACFSNO_06155 [Streptomyces cirratus]
MSRTRARSSVRSGTFTGGLVHGRVERVQQFLRLLPAVPAEPDDPVGGEARAHGGNGVEQRGTARSGRSGQPYGAAPAQQPFEPLPLLLALEQGAGGGGGEPGSAGGRPAASQAAREAGPRLAGRAVPVPGRRGSISLPSTG